MIVGNLNENQLNKYKKEGGPVDDYNAFYKKGGVHVIKCNNFIEEGGRSGHLLIFRDPRVKQIIMNFLGDYHWRSHREMSVIVFCSLDIITEFLKRRID